MCRVCPAFVRCIPLRHRSSLSPTPVDRLLSTGEQIDELLDMKPVPAAVMPSFIKSTQDMIRTLGGSQEDVDTAPRAVAAANAEAAIAGLPRLLRPKEVRHRSQFGENYFRQDQVRALFFPCGGRNSLVVAWVGSERDRK